MDNITHTLTGLMLSKAGRNRWTGRGTLLLVLAANAPDVDLATAFGGPLNYLHFHRGLTHSLAMIPVLALLPVLLVLLGTRKSLDWKRAYAAAVIGVASHVLMDWTNIYGVRLLLPFSDQWLRLDCTGVVDAWILAVLLLAFLGPVVSRLVSSEIGARPGSGRGLAVFALSFLLFYDFGRYLLHQRAVAVLDSRIYAGGAPLRLAALPSFVNPFRWVGLVEETSSYEVHMVNLLEEFDPTGGRILYKPQPESALEAARKTKTFQEFLRFSQYPLWRVTPLDEPEKASRVEAMDLRFGLPPNPRFVATAVVDGDSRVRRSWFQFEPSRQVAGRRR